MKIIVLTNYTNSVVSFRGALLAAMAATGHQVTVCAPGEHPKVAEELLRDGVSYRSIALDRTGMNPIDDFRSCLKLVILFRKVRPDLVLSYTVKPVIYGSLAASLSGVNSIYSVITGLGYAFGGDTVGRRLLSTLVRSLYRRALSVNRAVFFLNPDDRATFLASGLIEDARIAVMLHGEGVDLDYYAEQPPVAEPPVFLLIARLIKDKGILEYIAAARMVKRRYPQAVFRLLGPYDSNPSAITEGQVSEWQGDEVVEYLGETGDVRPFLSHASVFVLPSYREGLPRTVVEAMAAGRPIVTTNVPGCRETVVEGDNGFLVPVGDAEALAAAMERFIVSPELIGRMGKRSREIAEEKYDVKRVNAVIMKTMGLADEKGI